jgi:hypothetical protein
MNAKFECDGCGACCRTKLVDLFEVTCFASRGFARACCHFESRD